jgi:uncharacterized protein (DUF427 family)
MTTSEQHRVDAVPGTQHVRIERSGQVVAETRHPLIVSETGLADRFYIPAQDVNFDLLAPTESHTTCPYKGVASYWTFRSGNGAGRDVAWAYPDPLAEVSGIRDHLSFYEDAVDTVVETDRG